MRPEHKLLNGPALAAVGARQEVEHDPQER
jgi:hypothetical protein